MKISIDYFAMSALRMLSIAGTQVSWPLTHPEIQHALSLNYFSSVRMEIEITNSSMSIENWGAEMININIATGAEVHVFNITNTGTGK